PLLLEVRQVLVHGGERAQAEVLADLLDGGGVTLPLDVPRQVVEDLFLASGQVHPYLDPTLGENQAKVNARAIRTLSSAAPRGRGWRDGPGRWSGPEWDGVGTWSVEVAGGAA